MNKSRFETLKPRPIGWGFLLFGFPAFALFIFGGGIVAMAAIRDAERFFLLFSLAYSVAFLGYLGLLVLAWKSRITQPNKRTLFVLFFIAALARVAMVGITPCDDVYRYAWEARVSAAGYDPATTPPADSLLTHLRDADFIHINHPRMATVYPEVAQWAFRIGFDQGLRTWKWLLLICDLASIALLFPFGLVAILGFALNPLLIFEGVGRGHFEPLWLVLIVLIWRCYQGFPVFKRNLDSSAGVFISIAMLIKPQAVLLAWPFLSKKLFGSSPKAATGRLANTWSWLQILTPILVAILWIAWKYGNNLNAFVRGYQYNSWLPWLVTKCLHLPLKTPHLDAVAPALLLLVAMGLLWKGRHLTFASQALWLLGALLIGSKTFHPWYTLWLLPFAAMRAQPFWILLSWTQILGLWPYWLQSKGLPWHEISWLRWAIVLPPLCISGMLWWRQIRKTKSNSKSYAS